MLKLVYSFSPPASFNHGDNESMGPMHCEHIASDELVGGGRVGDVLGDSTNAISI